jgi:hypothetical protein
MWARRLVGSPPFSFITLPSLLAFASADFFLHLHGSNRRQNRFE